MKRLPVITTLYLVFAAVFFLAVYKNNHILAVIMKTLPVALLAYTIPLRLNYQKYILGGLLFSATGDLLLQLDYAGLFIYGLTAFLIAHLFYIKAFLTRNKKIEIKSILPLITAGAAGLYFLIPYLDGMKIPVITYMTIILIMLWRSYVQRNCDKFAKYAFAGALLFVISDSVIAVDKFVFQVKNASILIMITYWTAQYLIFYSAYKAQSN